jgi:hypothetical protein
VGYRTEDSNTILHFLTVCRFLNKYIHSKQTIFLTIREKIINYKQFFLKSPAKIFGLNGATFGVGADRVY